jgi:serine phosphatase RsbU (regulator of sigma subunit)
MIGVAAAGPRPVTVLPIAPGALLCLYTDGLVERPGQVIDEGMDRLRRAVTSQPPEAACATVMNSLIGREPSRDDIALLMFRRQPAAI